MAGEREVKLSELARALERDGRDVMRAISRGVFSGAQGGRKVLVDKSPTDQGQLRNAWKVSRVRRGAGQVDDVDLVNEAPHAGVAERGARPHKVSAEGWAAIYQWVLRHRRALGMTTKSGRVRAHRPKFGDLRTRTDVDPAVARVVWGIVKKIELRGQAPTYFVRNAVPEVTELVHREVEEALREQAAGRGRR